MSRQIKCRVWDNKAQKYITDYSLIGMSPEGVLIPICESDDLVFEQYTELEDKNGVEVCESDIVRFCGVMTADNTFGADPNGYIYDGEQVHVVIYGSEEAPTAFALDFGDEEHWKYKRDTYSLFVDGEHMEVIGNIHENPELLDGKGGE